MRRILYAFTLLYAFALPFERSLRAISDEGSDSVFKPYRVVAMAMGIAWVVWIARSKQRRPFDLGDKTFLAIFGYGLVMALFWNVLGDGDLRYTGEALPLITLAFAGYVMVKSLRLDEREIEVVFRTFATGVVTAMAISIARGESTSERLRGFYKNPNQLGVTASACFLFFLATFLFKRRSTVIAQIVRVAFAAVLLTLMIFSGSRGAIIATLVASSVVALLAVARKREGRTATRLGVFVVLIAGIAIASFDRFDAAFEDSSTALRFQREQSVQSAEERTDLWKSGIQVGVEHFGLGAGMAQYLSHHLESVARVNPRSGTRRAPLGTHSDYVDLFASYGIFGVLCFLNYAFVLARTLIAKARTPASSYVAPLGLALLTHSLIASISKNSFTNAEYFLLMALVDSCAHLGAAPSAATARMLETAGVRPVGV